MKKSVWGKIGWFVVAFMPTGLSLLLQEIIASFGIAWCSMVVSRQNAGLTKEEFTNMVEQQYSAHLIDIIMIYQLIALVIFGVWYVIVYGTKKRPDYVKRPGMKEILVIILSGIFLQVMISGILEIIYLIMPDTLSHYMELLQNSGITGGTLEAFVTTVILAPIGEEMLCRGITLHLAEKVSEKFWIANCIQAFAFGLMHANWVQGIYAFGLGLILGYVYEKYRNIWLCMILHASVNFSSNFVSQLWYMLPEQGIILQLTMICCLCFALLGLGYKVLEEATEREL
jgi:hypothetical protein